MLFLVFAAMLSFLLGGTGAVEGNEIPTIRQTHYRQESSKCHDVTPLLNKLVQELEDIKGKIMFEIPEQLDDLKEKLAKQANETKKIVNDLAQVKSRVKKQSVDKVEVIKKSVKETCCQPDLSKLEASVEALTNGNRLILQSLQSHDENLRVHDQCPQNLTDKDPCSRSTSLVCDCADIKAAGHRTSGVYRVYVDHSGTRYYANAYCDMTTTSGNWMIFQRRKDGSEDFYRGWSDYANGFGNPSGEFWLGNEFLHLLTSKRRYRLRIDLEDWEGNKRFAEYSAFSISSLTDKYRLTIGSYSGNAGDSLSFHSNRPFSTKDADNDGAPSGDCATRFRGAWWYVDCYHSNLNGLFYRSGTYTSKEYDGIVWVNWRGYRYSLKTEMKISPVT